MNPKTIAKFNKQAFTRKGVPEKMLDPKWDACWFHVFREEFQHNRNSQRMSTIWCVIEQILVRRKLLPQTPERPSERAMRLSAEIDDHFRQAIKYNRQTGSNSNGASLKRAYAQDAADLQAIFDLYKEGKLKEAYAIARKVDTIVREQIPHTAWELMQEADEKAKK